MLKVGGGGMWDSTYGHTGGECTLPEASASGVQSPNLTGQVLRVVCGFPASYRPLLETVGGVPLYLHPTYVVSLTITLLRDLA